MRPVTESLEYLDISSGTSQDFNKLIRSVSYDITNVFNMANSNEKLTEQNMSVIIQENLFLQRRIKELEDKITSIEQTMASRVNSIGYNYLYKTFYTADDVEFSPGLVFHDASYGIITLPHTNAQKIPLLKYPREFLKKNIDIKVSVLGKTISMATDPTLLNIIDGDEASFWVTEVDTGDPKWGPLPADTTYVDFTVTINMPLRILPSLAINSVGVKPHPMYSAALQDIKYIGAANSIEYRLPTFPVSGGNPVDIQAVDSVKFMFPTITTSSMTFSFRQPYYIQTGDTRKFVIGIRNIDLENVNVTNEEASFITVFKTPGDNRYFLRVLEPTAITLNDESYGDAITHELFYDRNSTIPFAFGSDINADINTVYIKTTVKRTGDIIPAIRGIKLQYLPK